MQHLIIKMSILPSLYCFYDVTIKLSLHSAFQLLRKRSRPFPKTKTSNIGPTPNTEMHLALSLHFSVEMLISISHHGHITKECRMVIYFYHIDISFFWLHLRQLKRSWNTFLFVIFIGVLFYLEKSLKRGIGILFISFLFVRSFSLPPTCL
jgi:hypothetical protein